MLVQLVVPEVHVVLPRSFVHQSGGCGGDHAVAGDLRAAHPGRVVSVGDVVLVRIKENAEYLELFIIVDDKELFIAIP